MFNFSATFCFNIQKYDLKINISLLYVINDNLLFINNKKDTIVMKNYVNKIWKFQPEHWLSKNMHLIYFPL